MGCNCIQKAGNFAGAMARAAKAMLIGDPVFVTHEHWEARLATCVKCEHYVRSTATVRPQCDLCGCPLREDRDKPSIKDKAWLATEDCPAGKWAQQLPSSPLQ